MADGSPISRDRYEALFSSRCWWYTPLDGPWERIEPLVHADAELHAIIAQEEAIAAVPRWAQEIVLRCIKLVPPCGHHMFPLPQLQVLEAIGNRAPPAFFAGCYTVDPRRKAHLQDICFCLDAWLAGADPADAARELEWRSPRKIDWTKVCAELWRVLGTHTEWRDLVVERLVMTLRADVKQGSWAGDRGDRHGPDQFVGAIQVRQPSSSASPSVARYDTGRSPRFMRVLARLDAVWPRTLPSHRRIFEEWWPCAPKSLRFIERMLWVIGRGELASGTSDWRAYLAEEVPGFLQCEDTYPDQHSAALWWPAFCAVLDAWWRGENAAASPAAQGILSRLGEPDDTKRWLVRLYRHKLRLLESNGEQFTRLVRADGTGRRGHGRIDND